MRARNITRTVIVNHVIAFVYNKASKAMEEKNFSVVGDYDEKDIESIVKAKVKESGAGALADYEVIERESVLRSMSEEDFYNSSATITRGKTE